MQKLEFEAGEAEGLESRGRKSRENNKSTCTPVPPVQSVPGTWYWPRPLHFWIILVVYIYILPPP